MFKVPNLHEGEEYMFRIIAVNDVGRSEPSQHTASKSRHYSVHVVLLLMLPCR